MKRAISLMLAMMLVVFAGCSNKDKEKPTQSPQDIVDIGMETLTFDDEMEVVDSKVAHEMLGIDSNMVIDSYVYMNSGASAEIFGVFRCETEEQAEKIENVLETYVQNLAKQIGDYMPDKAQSVSSAIVDSEGIYAYICISSDSEIASGVIDKLF